MQSSLGQILKEARIEKGLSQRRLAKTAGVARQVLARWESGQNVPSEDRLKPLSKALEMPLEQLVSLRVARPAGRPRRHAGRGRRRMKRPAYPVGATVEQMLRLAGSEAAHRHAVKRLPPADYGRIIEEFPRDTPHELLAVFHVLDKNSFVVTTTLDALRCPLFVLDDFEWVYGGSQRQTAVLWRGEDELMVLFGQVRVRVSGNGAARLDLLVYYKRRRRPGQWIFVELDGRQHRDTPNQDADRAVGIGIPELRYDNEQVLSWDFFQRLIQDVRAKALVGRKWDLERLRKAKEERSRRELQASERRAA